MTEYRPDVSEALAAAGWSRALVGGEFVNGSVRWSPTSPEGASAIWVFADCIAEFRAYCPVIVVVAACLAAAGQTVERLADVIPLRPTP